MFLSSSQENERRVFTAGASIFFFFSGFDAQLLLDGNWLVSYNGVLTGWLSSTFSYSSSLFSYKKHLTQLDGWHMLIKGERHTVRRKKKKLWLVDNIVHQKKRTNNIPSSSSYTQN